MPDSLLVPLNLYAGIGSRETPSDALDYIQGLARLWAESGITLRSGGAKGADTAFEKGCDEVEGPKEIFTAKDATAEAMEHAAQYHPNWGACKPWARKLHARNSMIVLGRNLDEPVDMVICWTRDGVPIGGTAQGIRVAEANGIKVVNLGDPLYGFKRA